MELTPLNRKILLKPVEDPKETKTSGGLFLPEKNDFDLKKAEVISLGDKVELKLKPGDKVLYQEIGVDKIDGKILIDDSKIVALIR